MRLIDADALKEKFINANAEGINLTIDRYALKCIDHAPTIEPERKTGQWILCSERLPDVDDDGYTDKVLVSFDNYCGVEICEYRIINGVGKWYAGDTDDAPEDLGLRITAWMPLPEPYTGDKE